MPYFDNHFTLQEAQNLLPRIRAVFLEIHGLIDRMQSIHEPVSILPQPILESRTNGHANGKTKSHASAPQETDAELRQKIHFLLTEITDHGIVIQDVQRGLIDFPSFVQGEEVFLCYELNDGDAIQFWHPIESGYAGRRPIEGFDL